ncbi:UDP pyrophosphate synthase [Caloranaerobacter sp. TR13]|uniref:isoprenyl transferase n=1 Tax=Caloranaerobacter sp. TR13 TaxID=1302151 RepID=UPI0006D488DF|nr:isoprenyl transferase [Caloranaerobacter sp. TR13]KPU28183.1 UDP pyrophosphate synthase [Caloranaerobacter sp. TR13]
MFGNTSEEVLKKEKLKSLINRSKLPRHIAIIMDGNGRWAKKRFLPRTAGHREGVERVKEIVKACGNLGIKYLTLYTFSTENWARPKDEVDTLMKLLVEYLRKELDTLHKNNVRIKVLGNIDELPNLPKKEIIKAIEKTKNNEKLILNIALNYGSRDEIIQAVRNIIFDVKHNKISVEEINKENFKKYLYTSNQPDPDLLIRTSGEQRVSNFLLYQIAYSEFYFTNTLWPDFKEEHLYKAILEYQNRERRFGKI